MAPSLRRSCLVLVALAGLASPSLGAGCAPSFDAPSQIRSLRVLAVVPDKPYAAPGDEVEFTMTYVDAFGEEPRPVQITWLGGCFDPEGDQYFACYEQLAEVLQGIATGQLPPSGLVSQGVGFDRFTLKLPEDIVSRRPVPEYGPHYGIAYLFFAACAGTVQIVPQEGTSNAGSFPLGCFDAEGKRLGAESFVPGYTQIYAFADGRANTNPPVTGLTLDGVPVSDDFAEVPEVKRCVLTEDERRVQGCSAQDPAEVCTEVELEVIVPDDVAEADLDARGSDGQQLLEAVWVDYYVEGGDLDADIKLVSDPTTGINQEREVMWLPPDAPGILRVWAVVHDARGGATVVERLIRVVE